MNKKDEGEEKSRGMMVIHYVKGLYEKVTMIRKKRHISMAIIRPYTTLRRMLMRPKDKQEPT